LEITMTEQEDLDVALEQLAEEEEVPAPTFDERWALAFKDRGMGHGDFAVIEERSEDNCPDHGMPPTLIVECGSRELAESIIQAHNQHLAMRKALKDSMRVIDDWLHTFAPEFCGEECVAKTHKRICDAGGTLALIAYCQERNRKALGEE
jgi:hypothetical protein